jgi:hypothetical protein
MISTAASQDRWLSGLPLAALRCRRRAGRWPGGAAVPALPRRTRGRQRHHSGQEVSGQARTARTRFRCRCRPGGPAGHLAERCRDNGPRRGDQNRAGDGATVS